MHDWNQNGPSTAIWNGGIYAQLQLLGGYLDRIVDVLQGRDERLSGKLSAEEREAISQILAQTHPRYAAKAGKTVASR